MLLYWLLLLVAELCCFAGGAALAAGRAALAAGRAALAAAYLADAFPAAVAAADAAFLLANQAFLLHFCHSCLLSVDGRQRHCAHTQRAAGEVDVLVLVIEGKSLKNNSRRLSGSSPLRSDGSRNSQVEGWSV